MYRVPNHIWRTTDGRLVRHEHPEAAFLAYPSGTELSDEQARRTGVLGVYAPAPKRRARPADKQAPRPTDKGGLGEPRTEERS